MAGNSSYPVLVFWSDEDECYVADFPDLEYCSAFGATPQEAVAEAVLALEGWLEVAQERKLAEARS
jgi:predicted RNase H-like HicB family nuclease